MELEIVNNLLNYLFIDSKFINDTIRLLEKIVLISIREIDKKIKLIHKIVS